MLAPLEAELWADADAAASVSTPAARRGYLSSVGPRLGAALTALGSPPTPDGVEDLGTELRGTSG
ncbi:MAG: hypothetical protein U5R31_05690 [Acidimicrobiia bacterium]|nr:hypothetical protein [Acidimicrobiia bacterium]